MESHQATKTIPEQVLIAENIFREVMAAGVPVENDAGCIELLKRISRDHKDFYTTHPIVVRYMCQLHAYDSGAFAQYLQGIAKCPAAVMRIEGFLDSQANYVVKLMRAVNPKGVTGSEARALKKQVKDMLRAEYDELRDKYTEAVKKVETEEARTLELARAEFKKAISSGVSGVGTVRVESPELLVDHSSENTFIPAGVTLEGEKFSGADEFL